ncbi:MAG: hypothetical protein WD971_03080, partial [Pirellulales bacterium]
WQAVAGLNVNIATRRATKVERIILGIFGLRMIGIFPSKVVGSVEEKRLSSYSPGNQFANFSAAHSRAPKSL